MQQEEHSRLGNCTAITCSIRVIKFAKETAKSRCIYVQSTMSRCFYYFIFQATAKVWVWFGLPFGLIQIEILKHHSVEQELHLLRSSGNYCARWYFTWRRRPSGWLLLFLCWRGIPFTVRVFLTGGSQDSRRINFYGTHNFWFSDCHSYLLFL